MKQLYSYPIVCAGLAYLFATSCSVAAELTFFQQDFYLPIESENVVVADLNGDGLLELIAVLDNRLQIYFQGKQGYDFASENFIEFPGQAIGWDLSTQYGASVNTAIIALVEGREVLAWFIEGENIPAPITVKSGFNGFLRKGVNRLHFSRDINADTIDDFLIPGAGVINLHISKGRTEAGIDYQDAFSVRSELRMRTNLNEISLDRRTGQSLRIPMMELRDVNSDGFDDLVSRTDEELRVFIANPKAATYFPNEASYSLDILEIETRLGEFDIDNLDFSNLTGLLALTHEEILEDVDGDGIDDLLVREGGKVSLFGGTVGGMNFTQPRQVLRSGGNVLSTFLRDENDDGLKDLWLWRVENISVADIFVWLAFSGSIAIEAFIYPNDGERFARRPTRKITIDLKFPSVISLTSTFREIQQDLAASHSKQEIFSSTANLDADISQQDLILMINTQIEFFVNTMQAESVPDNDSDLFLGALNYSRNRDNYEFNIRELIKNISIAGNRHVDAIQGRTADRTITLNRSAVAGGIYPVTLNQDGRDDVLIFTETDSSHIRGLLLLSN